MISPINVIWGVSRVSPNGVATLWKTFKPVPCRYLKKPTLIHMQAPPTQFRSNLARSLFEKKRSNAQGRKVSILSVETQLGRTIGTRGAHLNRVFHLPRKESRHRFGLCDASFP